VLLILVHPVLDYGDFRRFILGGVMFAPVIIGTARLAQTKRWATTAVLLMLAVLVFTVAGALSDNYVIAGMKWGWLAAFFALAVIRLFSYLRNAPTIDEAHLATAVSIYLLLGMLWFAVYNFIDVMSPGAISHNASSTSNRASELLYFSLITLTTIGYGDVVPLHGEARMLAALEGVTGVLYVAITVALLVSAYKPPSRSE
jgi:hypothetical protein